MFHCSVPSGVYVLLVLSLSCVLSCLNVYIYKMCKKNKSSFRARNILKKYGPLKLQPPTSHGVLIDAGFGNQNNINFSSYLYRQYAPP